MSRPQLSQLIPLDKNTNITSSNKGLLNPMYGRSLSTTPSPTLTPLYYQNISTLGNSQLPSLSPAPSPLYVSSGMMGPLTPLPSVNISSLNAGSLTPSPVGGSKIEQSLENLRSMPPSPTLGKLPAVGGSKIEQSLANLRSMPPSPVVGGSGLKSLPELDSSVLNKDPIGSSVYNLSSPSLDRLAGFKYVDKLDPITLPIIPKTGKLNTVLDTNLKPLVNKTTNIKNESPSITSYQNYQGMLQDKNVEDTLIKSGYLPVDKILTKDDNGNMICQYIKAIDETGRSTFVDLDCDGYVSVDQKDMTMVEKSNASVIPYSVKMGTYECASSDVCGVAFECDNEICTLKRTNESLTPTETVFTHTKTTKDVPGHKEYGILNSHPIPYPIVKLSEIKSNPSGVSCSIKDSHNRMRNASFGQTNKDTKDLVNAEQNLQNAVNRYNKIQTNISHSLNKTIDQLEKIHEQYKRSPPTSDKEKENIRSVHYNLRKRHDLAIDYLKLSESVNSRVHRIKELTGEIESLNDYADKLFVGLDFLFTE